METEEESKPVATNNEQRARHVPRSPHPPTFGDLLRRYRVVAGWTQEGLAEAATVSVRTVAYLEQGKITRPQRETVRLLADALDLSDEARALFEATARPHPTAVLRPVFDARVPHNLPAPVTLVIGRDDDRAAVAALLCRADVRLVTITGFGGVGKTRLGLEVATRLLASFPDGVFFVPLAPVRHPAFVLDIIARTLGITEASGQELRDSLVAALRGKRLLLVLDNFEHLLPAAGGVAGLLAGCP